MPVWPVWPPSGPPVSLGAIVRAFDTRLEVAEQIESMGGEFLKLDFGGEDGASSDGYAKVMSEEFIKAEMELFAQQARKWTSSSLPP